MIDTEDSSVVARSWEFWVRRCPCLGREHEGDLCGSVLPALGSRRPARRCDGTGPRTRCGSVHFLVFLGQDHHVRCGDHGRKSGEGCLRSLYRLCNFVNLQLFQDAKGLKMEAARDSAASE